MTLFWMDPRKCRWFSLRLWQLRFCKMFLAPCITESCLSFRSCQHQKKPVMSLLIRQVFQLYSTQVGTIFCDSLLCTYLSLLGQENEISNVISCSIILTTLLISQSLHHDIFSVPAHPLPQQQQQHPLRPPHLRPFNRPRPHQLTLLPASTGRLGQRRLLPTSAPQLTTTVTRCRRLRQRRLRLRTPQPLKPEQVITSAGRVD